MSPRTITLTCFLGHTVGTLTHDPDGLTLAPRIDDGHLWGREKRKMRDLADSIDNPNDWDHDPDELAEIRHGLMHPREGLAGQSSTLTPDRKALAWACMSCWRAGISGAAHRRRTLHHYGRTALRPFLSLLLVLAEDADVIATETHAKKLRDTLPDVPARQLDALAERAREHPAPTDDQYEEWKVIHYLPLKSPAARPRR